MAANPNKLTRFWQELKRRRVVHVITVYATASFVIIELINNLTEPLNLPAGISTIVVVVLAVGFPLAVILSWIYDLTAEGIEKTQPLDEIPEDKKAVVPNAWKITTYISFVVIAGLIVFNIIPRSNLFGGKALLDKSIAVLPFINDSPDVKDAHIINGTMASIHSNLCKIKDLSVLDRSSVEQYRDVSKPLPDIAKEMNVSYVLGGSIQKLGSRIILFLQLIERNNGNVMWSEKYDRTIQKVEDLIDIQSEVSQLVAAEIEAIITPEEKQLIEKIPTLDLTAYDFFLRGREEHEKYDSDHSNKEALKRAEKFYRQTLELDSTFAQAYVELGYVYWIKHHWDTYFDENFLDSMLVLANIALSFDDQLDEAYNQRGQYYRANNTSVRLRIPQ